MRPVSVADARAGMPEDHAFTITSPLARQRRSTEFTLLVMAALITGSAYTITALGTNAEIPPGIVVFVAILFGLLMCAHIVVRLVARGADGTLLPLAALLHGIGFVMITRLDDRLAGLQATWSVVAIGAFIATLFLVQRATDLARYRWLLFFLGAGALMLPLVPGLGQEHQRRTHLGQPRPDQLPAGRVRQDRPRHLLRRVPGRPA